MEALRVTGCASTGRPEKAADQILTCEQCGVQYSLYCDNEAAVSFTCWSLLAQEIITARHPYHDDRVALDRIGSF